MTIVHYTEEAENLFEIGVYTWTEWGERQSVNYLSLLRETCEDTISPQASIRAASTEATGALAIAL